MKTSKLLAVVAMIGFGALISGTQASAQTLEETLMGAGGGADQAATVQKKTGKKVKNLNLKYQDSWDNKEYNDTEWQQGDYNGINN